MNIGKSANVKLSAARRLVHSSWLALVASILVVSVAAQQYRPAPQFMGKSIPEPPSQGQPWTAPTTKLPKFLVTATGILFEQGVADPRGCEYRQVEVGNGSIVKARGFVLPERADTPGRFVVCWDGQVYPALTVGAPADLDRDINDLAVSLKQAREAGKSNRINQRSGWGFSREGQTYFSTAGVDDRSPIKLCLLLQLGRADLAEVLFAARTTWTPEPRARDLTDYQISYLTLAIDWAASAFGRLVGAHMRGDDVIALDAARKLARFRDLASARADAMGFPQPDGQNRMGNGPATRFYFLTQLDDLLRDQERRAQMPPRGPIPRKGGDPAARVAALIRDLDQIDEQQMSVPGGAYPGHSPLVADLIAEGDPAVAPLLEVLESDNRLTRSVSNARGGSLERFVHPVHEAAFAALVGILKTREFANQSLYGRRTADPAARKALASSMRRFWEKTRSVPLIERWYQTLLDDSAGPQRWLEAAWGISHPESEQGMPFPKPGTRPMQGEALRVGREPSVTELMLRRARQIERMGQPQMPDPRFVEACGMGSNLAAWDEKAALPLLKELMKGCRARSDRWRAQKDPGSADRNLASSLARFTQIRVRLGDLEALDEYAAWLRTTTPKMLEYATFDALPPLLAHSTHPALAEAARWLFNDPESPWVPLLPEARGQQSPGVENLFASPLIVVAGFREGVLAGLADKTSLGTVEMGANGSIQRKIKNVPTHIYSSSFLDLTGVAAGVEYPFRYCDYLASKLSELEGCPRCDLFWPEARRDEAVAACVAHLKRFGASYTAVSPPGMNDASGRKAHLTFPILGKLATRDDVASARAIFSLEGQGEARLVKMPGFPQQARWLTLKDRAVTRTYSPEGVTRREYDTDGTIWQAEEVRKGDGWERFYGFVGHHVVARAPAAEIEFASPFSTWSNLKGGLDARIELVEPRPAGYEPGRPIVVAMHIRNRLGVDRSSPTEFIRPGPDGKPALRKGVNLALRHSPSRGKRSVFRPVYPNGVVEPKRDAHFDPGAGSRPLAPLDAFEAMRFDLSDWFDLTKPGTYRLQVTFAADSGIGEGFSGEAYFQVGGDE